MDNESQARFERIESNLELVSVQLLRVSEGLERNIKTQMELNESISRYVDAADARMKILEKNMDALIRAITAEHTNGKGKV
jgi:hypothetical protein